MGAHGAFPHEVSNPVPISRGGTYPPRVALKSIHPDPRVVVYSLNFRGMAVPLPWIFNYCSTRLRSDPLLGLWSVLIT